MRRHNTIRGITGSEWGHKVSHGLSRHRLYKTWCGMINRCYDAGNQDFYNYGGRGITICRQWLNSPSAFISWAESNGWKEGLELDRIDNDCGYSPENCRWVTELHQARNRRYCIINASSAAQIKKMLDAGVYQRVIAEKFGCSRSNIREIKLGHSWADISPAE